MQETLSSQETPTSKKSTEKVKTLRPLSVKQRKWADKRLETGNGTQAALEVYDTEDYNTAAVISSENIKKPNVKAYLESKAERAAEIVFDIAENGENDNVRLGASKDILDRAGFKQAEKHINIDLELSQEERNKILGITSQVLEQMAHAEVNE